MALHTLFSILKSYQILEISNMDFNLFDTNIIYNNLCLLLKNNLDKLTN